MVGTSPFREASEGYRHSVVNVVLCKKYKKTWHYTVLLETGHKSSNCGQVNGHLQFYFVIIPEDPAEQFSAEETRPGHRIHGWPSVKYTAEPFPSFQCSMVPSRPSIRYISHKGDREWRSIYRLSLTHRRTESHLAHLCSLKVQSLPRPLGLSSFRKGFSFTRNLWSISQHLTFQKKFKIDSFSYIQHRDHQMSNT